jgi:hypothetical protein
MTTKRIPIPPAPPKELSPNTHQLQQQIALQSQSNQNLQLVLNSILTAKGKTKRPIPAFLNKLYKYILLTIAWLLMKEQINTFAGLPVEHPSWSQTKTNSRKRSFLDSLSTTTSLPLFDN